MMTSSFLSPRPQNTGILTCPVILHVWHLVTYRKTARNCGVLKLSGDGDQWLCRHFQCIFGVHCSSDEQMSKDQESVAVVKLFDLLACCHRARFGSEVTEVASWLDPD